MLNILCILSVKNNMDFTLWYWRLLIFIAQISFFKHQLSYVVVIFMYISYFAKFSLIDFFLKDIYPLEFF